MHARLVLNKFGYFQRVLWMNIWKCTTRNDKQSSEKIMYVNIKYFNNNTQGEQEVLTQYIRNFCINRKILRINIQWWNIL